MKSKKLALPAIILVAAIVAIAVYGTITNIAKKPTIPQHDFLFAITYELNGKTETFEGVYSVSYVGNDGYVDATTRQYEGTFTSNREDADTTLILSSGMDYSIYLYTNFNPDYLMGDPEYDYFSDRPFAPQLVYSHFDAGSYDDEQTLLEHGAKLISWEYPEPIENTFVFSHIAHLNGTAVVPFAVIAAVALLAVLVFVKKETAVSKQRIDKISVILNFVIALVFVPFATIGGAFSDINGSSAGLAHQMLYLTPAVTLLGLAVSVTLRRKGFGKGGFIAQFAGLAMFALAIVCEFFS